MSDCHVLGANSLLVYEVQMTENLLVVTCLSLSLLYSFFDAIMTSAKIINVAFFVHTQYRYTYVQIGYK
jgi:hypothetical protein